MALARGRALGSAGCGDRSACLEHARTGAARGSADDSIGGACGPIAEMVREGEAHTAHASGQHGRAETAGDIRGRWH